VARARSLSEFQTSFPDETSCAAFLFQRRWPQGFVCPACGGGRAALLKSRAHTNECLHCGRQTSITAGTAMHRSKLPLTVWFWAAHLMATHSNGMSAVQLEAQLGITYKTAWLLAQKLRQSTIDPQREPLEGVVEYLGSNPQRGWVRPFREVLIGPPACRSLSCGAAADAGLSTRLCEDCRARRYPSSSSDDGARRAREWFRTRRVGRSADCIGRQTR
jgi:predicted RNA-binding Zn-ribbon protein involved in translation (DUF1610 family)